jgi:hypothetical protein
MKFTDGDEKDKRIAVLIKSLEGETTDKCFVQLEVSLYTWSGSVAQAPQELWAGGINNKRCITVNRAAVVSFPSSF